MFAVEINDNIWKALETCFMLCEIRPQPANFLKGPHPT